MQTSTLMSSRLGILSVVCLAAAQVLASTHFGITDDEKYFTIDGVPTFLYGISYYGALGIDTYPGNEINELREDLDRFVDDGFNWIRVWTHGGTLEANISVTDPDGNCIPDNMERLKTLIEECNSRGIVVDITFARGGYDWDVVPHTHDQHKAVVTTVRNWIKNNVGAPDQRHFYFDLDNESQTHNTIIEVARDVEFHPENAIKPWEIRELCDIIKDPELGDPLWLCTVSYCIDWLDHNEEFWWDTEHEGNAPPNAPWWDENDYINAVAQDGGLGGNLDFLTPHGPVTYDGDGEPHVEHVVEITRDIREYTSANTVPVHLQETMRRKRWEDDCGWWCTVDEFYRHCTGGKMAHAAGWCFHTAKGFDLTEERFYDQLDDIESNVVQYLEDHIGSSYPYYRRYHAEYEEQLSPGDVGTEYQEEEEGSGIQHWGRFVQNKEGLNPGTGYLNDGPHESNLDFFGEPSCVFKALFYMRTEANQSGWLDYGEEPCPPRARMGVGEVWDNGSLIGTEPVTRASFPRRATLNSGYRDVGPRFTLNSTAQHSLRFLLKWRNLDNSDIHLDCVQVVRAIDIYVDGTTNLQQGDDGEWNAFPSGGSAYPDMGSERFGYQWWYREDLPGSPWIEIDGFTGPSLNTELWTPPSSHFELRVCASDVAHSGNFEYSAPFPVEVGVLSLFAEPNTGALPQVYAFHQNHPNPFVASTEIRFQLPQISRVSLSVYDMKGREMERILDHEKMDAGYHRSIWDPKDFPNGVYACRLIAGDFVQTRQIVFMREN